MVSVVEQFGQANLAPEAQRSPPSLRCVFRRCQTGNWGLGWEGTGLHLCLGDTWGKLTGYATSRHTLTHQLRKSQWLNWYMNLLCRSKLLMISITNTTLPHDGFSCGWVVICAPKRAINNMMVLPLWPLNNCLTCFCLTGFSAMYMSLVAAQLTSEILFMASTQKVLKHATHHNSITKLLRLEGTYGNV